MVAHLEKSSSPSVGFAILAQLKMINPIDYCQLKKDHIKPQIAVFFKIDIPVQLGTRGTRYMSLYLMNHKKNSENAANMRIQPFLDEKSNKY